MENILPFLAALAYMAYKVFDNYQKGQKETRERNPSQPYQHEAREAYSEWKEPEDIYVPGPVNDEPIADRSREPKYVPSYKDPVVEKRAAEYSWEQPVRKVEVQEPDAPIAKIVRNRAADSPLKRKFVASHEEEHIYSDFDFRDAIIKEAILNRPRY